MRDSWHLANNDFLTLFAVLQSRAAQDAMDSTVTMLAEQNDYVTPSGGLASPGAFGLGYAPSGISLESYFDIPATRTLTAIKRGAGEDDAMRIGLMSLERLASLALEDTSRSASGVSIAQRVGVGYVRVEDPTCCARCVILAGKYFRYNQGFLRHPHCHGRHVPVKGKAKAERQGWIADPMQAFEAMSREHQDKVFGPSSAQAIRDGADIWQVVNAQRGVQRLGAVKRGTVFMTTTEGTSRYGWSNMIRRFEYGQKQKRRLTPEGIYALARSREEVVSLLQREGYIIAPDWRERVPELRRSLWLHDNTYRQGRHETMTAAQKRLEDARLRYLAALEGRNPYGSGPATPQIMAAAENSFRRWLASDGEIFTK